MYPVSDAFRRAAVSGNQLVVVRAAFMLDGAEVFTPAVMGGSVTIDCRRDGALRSLSVDLLNDDETWAWLSRIGIEIKVWRGFTLPTGDELVPLGVFVLESDLERTSGDTISVSAADRSQRISRARWTDAYSVAAGVDVGTAVAGIAANRWPACPIGFTTVGATTTAQATFDPSGDSDPWKDARTIMDSAGFDLYFDADGVLQYRDVPDPATAAPCAVYSDGELSIVCGKSEKLPLAQTYNGVIATGEGSGVYMPVRGEAWDENPASPTYYLGPMGMVPMFYSSPLLTTSAACITAAQTRLSRAKGRAQQMSWDLVTNPAHESFDVIGMTAGAVTTRHVLDQLVVPLGAGTMNAVGRETVVA